MSQVDEFHRIRRILFATFHKGEQGRIDTFQFLESYKPTIDYRSYIGLKAELEFYKNYRKEFFLTPSLDAGEHSDFAGVIGQEAYRFDVTTNANYKKLKDYEPLQKENDTKYKIAVVNHSGDLEELIDINFPFCPLCDEGRMIDNVALLPENVNNEGDSLWTNDQVLLSICSYCQYYEEQNRISTHFMPDFNTEVGNTYDQQSDEIEYLQSIGRKAVFDSAKIIQSYADAVLPYLHKQFDRTIMALCDNAYKVTNPKTGDGYKCIKVKWRKDLKLLDGYIPDEYDIEIE